ncbi:MAG: glycosyltransferase family 2 protein [Propionibacteriaceae bacterium]|jgi:putative flippase GtrA|nr:glycosyltransferase family 2 protein [Propionibacteriaceae bacterium]
MRTSVLDPAAATAAPAAAPTAAAPGIALIPALDPDATFVTLVEDLVTLGLDVVVVDDGSGDAAAAHFDAVTRSATVLRHARNLGKGAALRTGLAWIADHCPGDAVIVTLDADGQHLPGDAAAVLDRAREHPGIVLGRREIPDHAPLKSRLGNAAARRLFAGVTGVRVSDTQTGLRAFNAALIPWLVRVPGQRFEYELNMLLGAAREGVPLAEVGIAAVYADGNPTSHFRPWRDTVLIGRDLARFALSSFGAFALDYALFSLFTAGLTAAGLAHAAAVANLAARAASATANYQANRHFVFHRPGARRSAGQYAILAVALLAANTVVLDTLVTRLALNPYVVKIGVELAFFAVSWAVQRHLVFRAGEPA